MYPVSALTFDDGKIAGRHSFRTMHILAEQMEVEAEIGALGSERGRRQKLIISVSVEIGIPEADTMAATLDYKLIEGAVQTLAKGGHIVLIETFAGKLLDAMLRLPGARAAEVHVRKPAALAPAMAGVRLSGRGDNK